MITEGIENLIRLKEFCKSYPQFNERSLRELIRQGRIVHARAIVRLSGRWMVNPEKLAQFVEDETRAWEEREFGRRQAIPAGRPRKCNG